METKPDEDTMISSQLNEMKTELKKLGGLKDLPNKFKSFENQLSNILNEITTIRSNMHHLKEENAQFKKRNRDLEEKNAKLDSQLNEQEQYGRRQNLEIHFFAVVKVSYMLTTCPHFDNLEIEIFDAGGPQCHFITSFTMAVRISTLSVH